MALDSPRAALKNVFQTLRDVPLQLGFTPSVWLLQGYQFLETPPPPRICVLPLNLGRLVTTVQWSVAEWHLLTS